MTDSRPVILITTDLQPDSAGRLEERLPADYARAVLAAGGLPVKLPIGLQPEERAAFLHRAGGLILAGGPDLDPGRYGQALAGAGPLCLPDREAHDFAVLAEAWPTRLPILAICLGHQELNVFLGGDLIQDLPRPPDGLPHQGDGGPGRDESRHPVTPVCGSFLARLAGDSPFPVNSSHHQAIGRLADGLRVAARAADGVIEAVEADPRDGRFLLSVQWHPERLWADPRHLTLFQALVAAAVDSPGPPGR